MDKPSTTRTLVTALAPEILQGLKTPEEQLAFKLGLALGRSTILERIDESGCLYPELAS